MHSTVSLFVMAGFISIATLVPVTSSVSAPKPKQIVQQGFKDYLDKPEPVFEWNVMDTMEADGVTLVMIELTSQTWREFVWKHQLTLAIPDDMGEIDTALIFVSGGSSKEDTGELNIRNPRGDEIQGIVRVAMAAKAPAAVLNHVPRQPLFDGLTEDEIISLTFQKYMETQDPTWPLLQPMVKSTMKAMDAITAFSEDSLETTIDKFVISGGSKRGWTTWLTGAHDDRVVAIAPMVIDMLNWDKHVPYHLEMWGAYSPQISDYSEKALPDQLKTDVGKQLRMIVDPYEYNERYTMPKMIFIGANDPYWPLDSIKFYWDELPGEKFIRYVPNTGHGLGDGLDALESLAGFFATTAHGLEHPSLSWETMHMGDGLGFRITGDESIIEYRYWETTSSDKDFRNNLWVMLRDFNNPDPVMENKIDYPDEGYKAFMIEAVYPSPAGGTYSKFTRAFILTPEKLY